MTTPAKFTDFLVTGELGGVAVGMTKNEIDHIVPVRNVGCDGNIWLSGNFELHFHDEWLMMIYSDYFEVPEPGWVDEFDPCGFRRGIAMEEIMEFFNSRNVMYRTFEIDIQPNYTNLETENGVEMHFLDTPEEEGDIVGLCAFWSKEKNPNKTFHPNGQQPLAHL